MVKAPTIRIGISSSFSNPTYGMFACAVIIIVQILIGGAAAERIAKMNTKAAVFLSERPI